MHLNLELKTSMTVYVICRLVSHAYLCVGVGTVYTTQAYIWVRVYNTIHYVESPSPLF